MDCTCTKPIGEDLAKGQVPKTAVEALALSGLFRITETTIQYLGGVGSRAKNEVGNWDSPDLCAEHAPKPFAPAPKKQSAPTEGDE